MTIASPPTPFLKHRSAPPARRTLALSAPTVLLRRSSGGAPMLPARGKGVLQRNVCASGLLSPRAGIELRSVVAATPGETALDGPFDTALEYRLAHP